jgi:alpha-glucosidase
MSQKKILLCVCLIFLIKFVSITNASIQSDISDTSIQMGDFILDWKHSPAQIIIRHTANTEKIVFETISGENFISAALAHIEVHENRGSFEVHEDVQTRLINQTVTAIQQIDQNVVISGKLSDASGKIQANTEITFSQVLHGHLQFNISVSDPQCEIVYLHYATSPSEQFFGFGEQFTYLNLKGYEVPIISQEGGLGRGRQPITGIINFFAKGAGGNAFTTYTAIPQYISSQFRSLFLETTEYATFNLQDDHQVTIKLYRSQMTGRILYGESYLDLLERYTEYCGRMIPLPDWLNEGGAIVGMEGGTEEVRRKWAELKAHDTPIAAFWVQDWVGKRDVGFGEQLWWNWVMNSERYPNWNSLVQDLKASDIRMMGYINPFLVDPNDSDYNAPRNLYQEALDNGYYIKKSDGSPYFITVTTFPSLLIDLSNPEARIWIKGVMKDELIANGFYGWMHDFAEALPFDAVLSSGEDGSSYHNQYMVEWVKLGREAVQEAGMEGQIVFFNRAGYTRSPAYTTLFWEGDQMVTWDEHDGFKSAIKGLISGGLSGMSINHSDIGGYTSIGYNLEQLLGPIGLDNWISWIGLYRREKSLLLRWMEANAFTSVYRTHEGLGPKDNAQFYSDEDSYAQFSRFAKVYKALASYRKKLMNEAYTKGYPLVRHMMLHYPDDPNMIDLEYQWMLGSEFLVAPVTNKYDNHVRLYLPSGKWVHVWSKQVYGSTESGEWLEIDAPIGKPAVFYREGATAGEDFQFNLRQLGVISGEIIGHVSTSILGDSTHIAGAIATIVQTGQTAKTNESGQFTLHDVPIGKYDINISKINFAPMIVSDILVQSEQTTQISVSFLSLDDCQCTNHGDINNDGIIGLSELIYTLKVLADKNPIDNQAKRTIQNDSSISTVSVVIDGSENFDKTIQNIEVNAPIQITFPRDIQSESLISDNLYITNSEGKRIDARIQFLGQSALLIPQEMMIPESSYTIYCHNLLDQSGKSLPNGMIHITTRDIDFGLYWFGKNGLCEKFIPGLSNNFYDPQKPTMIYTHGWKQEAVERNYARETFLLEEPDENISVYTNHSWIDKGWNTGILYWNQWCEESEIMDAEAKIWRFDGPQGSRYKRADGSFKPFSQEITVLGTSIQVNSVVDVLFPFVYHALKDNTGNNIRLIGHSLGNQVMTYLAKKLKEKEIWINRLALLEPVWTEGEKNYLIDENHDGITDRVSQRCLWYTLELIYNSPAGCAFEIYNSSALDLGVVGDSNTPLRLHAAETSIRPWYYGTTGSQNIEKKHNIVRYHYLWSFSADPPVECTINWNQRFKTGNVSASASTSDNRIRAMMGTGHYWDQVEGRYTVNPSDDWFEIKDCKTPAMNPAHIEGRVQTDLTGNSHYLSGVKITLLANNQSVFSDNTGSFSFDNVPFGIQTLLFEKEGYVPVRKTCVTAIDESISLLPVNISYNICECDFLPGDVNGDGMITLSDALMIFFRN